MFLPAGAGLHSNTLSSATALIPSLTKVVDNAVKQPGQVAIVSEAVHASVCLVKLAAVDMDTENSLNDFFSVVTDHHKQLFYSDKFISGAGPAALRSLATLSVSLLLSHSDRVTEAASVALHRSLASCLVANNSSVRRHGLACVGKLAGTLGGGQSVVNIARQITNVVRNRTLAADSAHAG